MEVIAERLLSRKLSTGEEIKLLSQFLFSKVKSDGDNVLKCAKLVAALKDSWKDWFDTEKESETLNECIEACLKNELLSMQQGINQNENTKNTVRFIGNLFRLQVLQQETFDSWKNFLVSSNNIVMANYLKALTHPKITDSSSDTDKECAFMTSILNTTEKVQMY